MIYSVGRGVLGHGRDVFKVIEIILTELYLDIIKLFNTLALIHGRQDLGSTSAKLI